MNGNWIFTCPILLLSGSDDPVGNFGKGVKNIELLMKKAGMSQIRMELIPHARHDVFHEKQSGAASQATDILLSFLKPFII